MQVSRQSLTYYHFFPVLGVTKLFQKGQVNGENCFLYFMSKNMAVITNKYSHSSSLPYHTW